MACVMKPASRYALSLRNSLLSSRAGTVVVACVAYVLGLGFDLIGGVYRSNDLRFDIPKNQTTRKGRGSFMLGTYEAAERELATKYLRPDSTVLELGACIGVVSCTVNKLLKNREKQVCIEANENLIPTLTRNRDQNSCKFAIVHGAISRKPICFDAMPQMECGRIAESGCPVSALEIEQLEVKYGLRFDTLIADIEGSESALLRENIQFFERLNLLIIEFHPAIIGEDEVSQLREFLATAGLKFAERRIDVEVYMRDHYAPFQ